jgi:hypothetical protein
MRIQPIVEGFGEVEAVPVLLRRLRDEAAAFAIDVNSPIRKKWSLVAATAKLPIKPRSRHCLTSVRLIGDVEHSGIVSARSADWRRLWVLP